MCCCTACVIAMPRRSMRKVQMEDAGASKYVKVNASEASDSTRKWSNVSELGAGIDKISLSLPLHEYGGWT